jgi:cytosine/adenosine deaminase-related metal-dependent hydrolase
VESGIPGSGVLATRSGTPLLPHGPAIHREMELRVRAGRSPSEVLQGATSRAAALLGASNRIGFLKPGFDASFILVEGNPLDDITVTQRLAYVMFLGEHVSREALLEQQQRLDKELDKETAPAAPKKSLGSGK